ncbi:MAG: DUF3990 domain-containing protein [Lachnospiraceae bacterium]|nr:DUF3990 domain-containing protein [Lachnospiraceae bacterium]
MVLYHGSHEIVESPTYGLGSDKNDYGRGFYCTEMPELAKEWACPTVKNGFMNQYELDDRELNVLHLNTEDYHILNWMALLLKNRIFQKRSPISRAASDYILGEFLPDTSGFDVIRGYRADDSYFSYAKDFLNNVISVHQLSRAMRLGELGEQVVLMTPKAFEKIKFTGYDIVEGSIYHARRMEREERARKAYLYNHGTDFYMDVNDLFVRDIITGQVKNDDARLR